MHNLVFRAFTPFAPMDIGWCCSAFQLSAALKFLLHDVIHECQIKPTFSTHPISDMQFETHKIL